MRRGAVVLALGVLCSAAALAEPNAETFTATASAKTGSFSGSAPVTVTVTKFASEAERAAVMGALRDGGTAGLRKVLSGYGDAGHIQVGDKRTPIKYAGVRSMGAGRLVTVITAVPILFLGAGVPAAKPTEGFEVGVAMLEVPDAGGGTGELAPAAKVGLTKDDAVRIDDYGATTIWLKGITRSK